MGPPRLESYRLDPPLGCEAACPRLQGFDRLAEIHIRFDRI